MREKRATAGGSPPSAKKDGVVAGNKTKQMYEIGYFKRKHGLTKEQAIAIIKEAWTSREKANKLAEELKNKNKWLSATCRSASS